MLHSKLNVLIIKQSLKENPYLLKEVSTWAEGFIAMAVGLEKSWAEELYRQTPSVNLEEIKDYITWMGNMLLADLGFSVSGITKNPMPWINVYNPDNRNSTKGDFFEVRVDNYSKAEGKGEDRWADL